MNPTSPARRTIPIQALSGLAAEARIQARSTSGRFTRWRRALAWLTQLVFYGLPWLLLDGRQAVLFDLEQRRFFLFHAVLYPQDLIHLAGLLVLSALLLFFATAVAGRVWCGFSCPQTVYTELFAWIEQRFEGNRQARLRLDASGWTAPKLLRRGGKHLAWALLGLWTGFTLVGYFTPIHQLAQALPAAGLGPWEAFWIGFYGLMTYANAGLLKEKVCQHMCPYGRFQGSLMDRDTLVVAYDERRGEPRGSATRGTGGCVDCTLCVQVCPVGIDIRQGLQAACIACGLCIDACNRVMDQLRQPRGLIRLASQRSIAAGTVQADMPWQRLARPRVLVYGGLLALVAALLLAGFLERPTLRLNAMRDRAVLARQVEHGAVENVYRLQLMNASEQPRTLRLAVDGVEGLSLRAPDRLHLPPAGAQTVSVAVRLAAGPAQAQAGRVLPLRFRLADDAGTVAFEAVDTDSTFLVPRQGPRDGDHPAGSRGASR